MAKRRNEMARRRGKGTTITDEKLTTHIPKLYDLLNLLLRRKRKKVS
jgi:hypothetical protein